ncbi:hypothetical protein [Nocardia sp. alder85J]|uniref:hypothetical protein n=1 Tax=Nocardia sp. alder85J TaxID=2862949 RepID=UPI001CD19B2D|nr:hypothetical protein [Nocardia sp. alder85J]MCX4092324.1 hypothetical protein [Nocardia sp. alder85J]
MAGRHRAVPTGRAAIAGTVPVALAVACITDAASAHAAANTASAIASDDTDMPGVHDLSRQPNTDTGRYVAPQPATAVPEVAPFDSLPTAADATDAENGLKSAAPHQTTQPDTATPALDTTDAAPPAPAPAQITPPPGPTPEKIGRHALEGAGAGALVMGVPAALVGGLVGGVAGAGVGAAAGLVAGTGGAALTAIATDIALGSTGVGAAAVIPAVAAEVAAALPVAGGAMVVGGVVGAGVGAAVGAAALGLPAAAVGGVVGAGIGAGAAAAGLD